MGSALPGSCLLDDSERRCESGEREPVMSGWFGTTEGWDKGVYLLAVYVRLRYAAYSTSPSPSPIIHDD